jgi:hypothetical protein
MALLEPSETISSLVGRMVTDCGLSEPANRSLFAADPECIFAENLVNDQDVTYFRPVILLSQNFYTEFRLDDPKRQSAAMRLSDQFDGIHVTQRREMTFDSFNDQSRLTVNFVHLVI